MKEITYKEAMDELQSILSWLDSTQPDVDEMEKKVKRAVELIDVCRKKLSRTDEAVRKIFEEMD